MIRTKLNATISLITLAALAAPAFAGGERDKVEAELQFARLSLAAHQDNVAALRASIVELRQELVALRKAYEHTGDPAFKVEIEWTLHNIDRHVIRVEEEMIQVIQWNETVSTLEAILSAMDGKGETEPDSIGDGDKD